jgi:hypothetical protein
MSRRLYRLLVRLHPPAFRREFAAEMLWIYDQAVAESGGGALVLDAFVSLVRQWVLRCGCWKIFVAVAGGLCQVSFACALMTGIGRFRAPAAFTVVNPELAGLMRLTAFTTVGLLAGVMSLVFWWRRLSRRTGV